MKKYVWMMAALTFASADVVYAAGDHKHDDHAPQHDGLVAPGKAADFELVAKADALHLYVSDHGKPMDVSKASAKVTLLSGAERTDVELKPAGDKLEAKGSFNVSAGTKVVAVVTNAGKTLGAARFTLK